MACVVDPRTSPSSIESSPRTVFPGAVAQGYSRTEPSPAGVRRGVRCNDAGVRRSASVIPIRDANPTSRVPIITLAIIAANVVAFLIWQPTFGSQGEQQGFFFCHAEIPWEVSHQTNLAQGGIEARLALEQDLGPVYGQAVDTFVQQECPDKSWLLSIFVAMFLHGGWLHIAGNMLFFWIFGNNIEDRMGYLVFPAFYVLGGLSAAGLQLAFDPNSAVPNLGASGAIGAVLGAYAVLFPRARVTTLVIFFFITLIEIPAAYVLGGWFLLQIFSGVGQLGTDVNAGVAYWAHVGGFGFGALVALLFYRRRGPNRPELDIYPSRPGYL
jgi:rhomboid family protein